MEKTILLIIAILFIISLVMFIFVRKMAKEVSEQLKKNYVLKLQDYDDLILERQKQIEEIENSKKDDINISTNLNKEKVICITPKEIDYKVDNLIEKLKEVDDSFKIDEVQTIKDFLENNQKKENIALYTDLVCLKKTIKKYGIYKLMTDHENTLTKIIEESSFRCKNFVNSFYKEGMNVNQFMIFLNNEIDKIDPVIYVETGDKEENYNSLGPRIKTVYNEDIYRGIKIYYHNKLYNYCLELGGNYDEFNL